MMKMGDPSRRVVRYQYFPRGKTLDGLVDEAKGFADLSLRAIGRVPPTMIATTPRGLIVHGPKSLKNDAEKDAFATECRLVLIATEAILCVMVLESWMVDTPPSVLSKAPPSESSHRIEVVTLCAESRSARRFLTLPIRRSALGVYSGFGDDTVPPGVEAQGRFAGMIPPKKPSRSDTDSAQAALAALGISLSGSEHDFSSS